MYVSLNFIIMQYLQPWWLEDTLGIQSNFVTFCDHKNRGISPTTVGPARAVCCLSDRAQWHHVTWLRFTYRNMRLLTSQSAMNGPWRRLLMVGMSMHLLFLFLFPGLKPSPRTWRMVALPWHFDKPPSSCHGNVFDFSWMCLTLLHKVFVWTLEGINEWTLDE